MANLTFGEWLDIYLKDCSSRDLAIKTIEGYDQIVEGRIKPVLGNTRLVDLSVPLLAEKSRQENSSAIGERSFLKAYR